MKNTLSNSSIVSSLKRLSGLGAIFFGILLTPYPLVSFGQTQFVRLVPTPHMQVTQLIKENKKKEALTFINNYIKTNPNDPQMLFWKAKILNESQLQSDRDEALLLYASLSENYPELAEPHNNLGVIFAAQGDYSKARHYFELALKANPNDSLASENLADLYIQEASKYYQNAVNNDPNNKSAKSKLEKLSPQALIPLPSTVSPAITAKPATASDVVSPSLKPR